ncbi:MAG: insulinase family protein [Saprospiraceae bacterium]
MKLIYSSLVIIFLFGSFYSCSPKIETPKKTTFNKFENPPTAAVKFKLEEPKFTKEQLQLPQDPDFKIGTLPNGMKYYIKNNSDPESRAELRLVVKIGSVDEDDDQLGIAHFIEHMQFNGTKNFSKNSLINYLESVGTKFGADLNAYTSFDETVYKLQVRTDIEGQLDTGLLVMYDWAGHATLDPEEIDKERGVVISEWRTRLSPQQRMMEEYFPVLYMDSKYAKRLPIGNPELIKNVDYSTIKRFYNDWYRPDLMALVVVGDINIDSMEQKVIKLFSTIEKPSTTKKPEVYYVPDIPNTTIKVVSDHEAPFTNIRIVNRILHVNTVTNDEFLQKIDRDLFEMMLQSRLNEIKLSANTPFTQVYSGYSQDLGDKDSYSTYAIVPGDKVIDAIKTVTRENERVKLYGFKQSELDRQYNNLLKDAEEKLNEKDKTKSSVFSNEAVSNFLDNTPLISAKQYYNFLKSNKDHIKLSEINAFAKKWFTENDKIILVTGPQNENYYLPDEELIVDALEEIKHENITDYVDNEVNKPLFDKTLQNTKLNSSETLEDYGIKKITLSNGIEVYYKQTDFKNDEILFSAYAPGGYSQYDLKNLNDAKFASAIVKEMGVSDLNNIQLDKLLTGKDVNVNNYLGELFSYSYGNSSVTDLETLFQLIYLKFDEPRKDSDAFKSYIDRNIGIYADLLKNPDYYFRDLSTKVNYDNNPREKGIPTVEDFKNLNLDNLYSIYNENYGDAGNFKFFFVGNFDEKTLENYCTLYLGNLKSNNKNTSWVDRKINFAKGKINKTINYGTAPKTYVNIVYHGDSDYSIENDYIFNSLIDALRIKLRESLREDLGGVYGVRVSGDYTKIPEQNYFININFNSDPPKTNTLTKAAFDVINKIKSEGIDSETLTKIKETQKQDYIKNKRENRFWLNSMVSVVKYGEKWNTIDSNSLIEKLNNSDIKNAANLYFNDNELIKLEMFPYNYK